jgi:peptidoglycan/xylan/chitin deacetylase (PgdA/CDA1 family)
MITFDDAYRDFATAAWPILRRAGLPVTLFVPTLYPDQPTRAFWWDRLHRAIQRPGVERLETTFAPPLPLATSHERVDSLRVLHRLVKAAPHDEAVERVEEVCDVLGEDVLRDNGVLGWRELKRLAEQGVTLAAHTRTHAILSRLSPDRIRDECIGSREDLYDRTRTDLPVISYPDGGHDGCVVRTVREAGFRIGLTTTDGINDLDSADLLRLRRTNITPRTNSLVFRIRMLPRFARIDELRHGGGEVRI